MALPVAFAMGESWLRRRCRGKHQREAPVTPCNVKDNAARYISLDLSHFACVCSGTAMRALSVKPAWPPCLAPLRSGGAADAAWLPPGLHRGAQLRHVCGVPRLPAAPQGEAWGWVWSPLSMT